MGDAKSELPVDRHLYFGVEKPIGVFVQRKNACNTHGCLAEFGVQAGGNIGDVQAIVHVAEAKHLKAVTAAYDVGILKCRGVVILDYRCQAGDEACVGVAIQPVSDGEVCVKECLFGERPKVLAIEHHPQDP